MTVEELIGLLLSVGFVKKEKTILDYTGEEYKETYYSKTAVAHNGRTYMYQFFVSERTTSVDIVEIWEDGYIDTAEQFSFYTEEVEYDEPEECWLRLFAPVMDIANPIRDGLIKWIWIVK